MVFIQLKCLGTITNTGKNAKINKRKNKIENICKTNLSSNLGRFWTEFFSSFCPSLLQSLKNSHKDNNRIVGGVFRLQKKNDWRATPVYIQVIKQQENKKNIKNNEA